MCVPLWPILLDDLRQQEPVVKNRDVFATILDEAGIVAHSAGQVRLHEQISSLTS
jgi:hypothetical protein